MNKLEKLQLYKDLDDIDSIVLDVIKTIIDRSKKGKVKYGTDLDRTDIEANQYLQELKEEMLDGVLYLTKYQLGNKE